MTGIQCRAGWIGREVAFDMESPNFRSSHDWRDEAIDGLRSGPDSFFSWTSPRTGCHLWFSFSLLDDSDSSESSRPGGAGMRTKKDRHPWRWTFVIWNSKPESRLLNPVQEVRFMEFRGLSV